jgi:hypothetical protein
MSLNLPPIENFIFNCEFIGGKKIYTDLPKAAEISRLALIAIAGFVLSFAVTATAMPFATAVGTAMGVGVTLYVVCSYLLYGQKDKLIDLFKNLVAGSPDIRNSKDEYEVEVQGLINFNKLPVYELPAYNDVLWDQVKDIDFNDLKGPISRAKTTDGRSLVILKGISEIGTRYVWVYVEKNSESDLSYKAKFSGLILKIKQLFFTYKFEKATLPGRRDSVFYKNKITGSISREFLQLLTKQLYPKTTL